MKYTTLLALAASVNGAVLAGKREAEASPEPWCKGVGQPCWKNKREAEAKAEPWCKGVGQPCWKVKRAAEALSDSLAGFEPALALRSPTVTERSDIEGFHAGVARRAVAELANVVAAARDAPAEYLSALLMDRSFGSEEDHLAVAKREPEPEPEPWCKGVGQPCWKRDPEPWCKGVGQPCWKRAVEEDKRWCKGVGQPCWKAKRAAEAVLEAVGQVKEREADPVADPWCKGVGQPCWKREAHEEPEEKRWCKGVGQPCWKAKRDLHAIENAARSVIESVD